MKKWIPLLAALLLLGGFISACRDSEPVNTAVPDSSPTPEAQKSETPPPTNTPEPSAQVEITPPVQKSREPEPSASPVASVQPYDEPDDEEVLAAYRAAVAAYRWFQVEPLPLDPLDSREVDGQRYYRVDYPGIDSTASLRGYLKSLFSDDLVEKLLPYDGTQYIDIDGKLYGLDGSRDTDITWGGETVQVLRHDNPNRCTVRVTVEVLDPEPNDAVLDPVSYDFPYEKVGEKWIFTDFSLVH